MYSFCLKLVFSASRVTPERWRAEHMRWYGSQILVIYSSCLTISTVGASFPASFSSFIPCLLMDDRTDYELLQMRHHVEGVCGKIPLPRKDSSLSDKAVYYIHRILLAAPLRVRYDSRVDSRYCPAWGCIFQAFQIPAVLVCQYWQRREWLVY